MNVATVPRAVCVHVPLVPFVETVDVPPTHIPVCVALSVPAFGAAVITNGLVVDTLAHPPVPNTTYLIVSLPAETGVTIPVNESTVARGFVNDHTPVELAPEIVYVGVEDEQIESLPLIVPATGAAVTVMFNFETDVQPLTVTVYLMVSTPDAIPLTVVPVIDVIAFEDVLVQDPPPTPLVDSVAEPPTQIPV